MKFYVYANDALIGWSDLPFGDPPMGVASGPFHPTEAYERIRPLIRERQKYDGSYGATDHERFQAVANEINKIYFCVKGADGQELHPIAGIHIIDFSEELDDDPYEVSVLGLPSEEYMAYFSEQYIRYENQFKHSEGQ